MTDKSGDAYIAAAKAWLNGMGYSEDEEQHIIKLALDIVFDNLWRKASLNPGIADIIAKYSESNLNAKNVS